MPNATPLKPYAFKSKAFVTPFLQTPGFGGWLANSLLTNDTSMTDLGVMLGHGEGSTAASTKYAKVRRWLAGTDYPSPEDALAVANLIGVALEATGYDPALYQPRRPGPKKRVAEPTSPLIAAGAPRKVRRAVRMQAAKEKSMTDNTRGRDKAMDALRAISTSAPVFPAWLAGEMHKRNLTMTDLGVRLGHGNGDRWSRYKRVSKWLHGHDLPSPSEVAAIKNIFTGPVPDVATTSPRSAPDAEPPEMRRRGRSKDRRMRDPGYYTANLRALLAASGRTKTWLMRQTDRTLSDTYLSKFLNGSDLPTPSRAYRMANALGATLAQMRTIPPETLVPMIYPKTDGKQARVSAADKADKPTVVIKVATDGTTTLAAPDPHTIVARGAVDAFPIPEGMLPPIGEITSTDEITLRIKCSDISAAVRLLQQAGIKAVI